MSTFEQKVIDGISEEAHKFLNSPISSPDGMMNVLKNGTFIAPAEQVFLPLIETALKNVTTALFLTRVLRSMVRGRSCGVSFSLKFQDAMVYLPPFFFIY
jgi:hypothetical protein